MPVQDKACATGATGAARPCIPPVSRRARGASYIYVDPTAANAARLERLLGGPAYGAAWRYACRLAQSREDAQDLLHDALVHALARLAQLRDETAFTPWLLSIVRTRFLMARRGAKRREAGYAPPAEPRCAPAWELEADTAAGLELAHALRALPPEQRALLCLHYLEGLSAGELAAAHGVSRASLEQRLHRARQALRRAWGSGDPQASVAAKEG